MLGPIAAPGGSVFALLVLIVLALIGDYPCLLMFIVSSTPPLWEVPPKNTWLLRVYVCLFVCLSCIDHVVEWKSQKVVVQYQYQYQYQYINILIYIYWYININIIATRTPVGAKKVYSFCTSMHAWHVSCSKNSWQDHNLFSSNGAKYTDLKDWYHRAT